MNIYVKSIAAFCLAATVVSALPGETLNKNFSRIKSSVMVRKVGNPTLANLDYAAYTANPVRFDPQVYHPKAPAQILPVKAMTFGGALTDACDSLNQTPLTPAEKEAPMAWVPLQKRLWEIVKTDKFAAAASKINSEKWGDPSVFQQFQDVTAVYLHAGRAGTELWVKVEVMPWVKFFKNLKDDDADEFKNFYGKLIVADLPADSLAKAIAWIKTDYCGRVLTKEEVIDWANVLASYWYPSLNTDIVDMAGQTQWPNAETEPKIKSECKGLIVSNPAAVIRGRPFGKPVYNVYVVENTKAAQQSAPATAPAVSANADKSVLDSSVSQNFKQNNTRFAGELAQHGSYEAWAKSNAAYCDSLSRFVKQLPSGQMGFAGKDDWLFFRKSLEYLLGGDLAAQAADKNPLGRLKEFKKYLDAHNVNFLFVPIPNKEELYYDKLPVNLPAGMTRYTNPYSRKFLKDLQEAGIEVIDVLPLFESAKADDSRNKENIYQYQDTHWTNRGLQIVAEYIARRIQSYGWYPEAAKAKRSYTVTDTVFGRQGDIVERLPEKDRVKYPAVTLQARQVKDQDGKLYRSEASAPILLVGDSFTGVFELVDCKSAGIGATIAAKTGLPVEIITSWGGGPGVRQKVIRAHKNNIGEKRLVIYMMIARDLYNYSQSWEALDTTGIKK